MITMGRQLSVSKLPVYFIRLKSCTGLYIRSGKLATVGVRPTLIKSRLELQIISSYRNTNNTSKYF